jgi:hypothetical protein
MDFGTNHRRFILAMDSSVASVALAKTLATVTGAHAAKRIDDGTEDQGASTVAVLDLLQNEESLGLLLRARERGFRGAGLLISPEPILDLWRLDLLAISGVHDSTGWPICLPAVIERTQRLQPISTGNMRLLQEEICASQTRIAGKVRDAIGNAGAPPERVVRELQELQKKSWVCSIWHEPLELCELGNRPGRDHFNGLIELLRDATEETAYRRALHLMEKLFDWYASRCAAKGLMVGGS